MSAEYIALDVTHYIEKLPKQLPQPRTKGSNSMKKKMRGRYPLLNGDMASNPRIIVDVDEIIMTWYLLGILSNSRQARLSTLPYRGRNLTPVRMRCWQHDKN